jgi:hypothetical protein
MGTTTAFSNTKLCVALLVHKITLLLEAGSQTVWLDLSRDLYIGWLLATPTCFYADSALQLPARLQAHGYAYFNKLKGKNVGQEPE